MTMPEVPDWHVDADGIHEETALSDHGTGLTVVHVVPFTIDSGPARGHHGVVRVSAMDYTPESITREIDAAASATHNVADLRRESV